MRRFFHRHKTCPAVERFDVLFGVLKVVLSLNLHAVADPVFHQIRAFPVLDPPRLAARSQVLERLWPRDQPSRLDDLLEWLVQIVVAR